MRKIKKEKELRALAENVSENITIRKYINGNSIDIQRKATTTESKIIFNVVYGALLGLNYGENVRCSQNMEQSIVDTAEFIINLFIPKCNGYDTVYNPLKKILTKWEND